MKLLTNIIVEYLKHNKRLVVPKLGAFIVKKPGGEIIFSELMRSDDGVLRSLLMAYGMKELEANGTIDRMAFEIRHAVGKGEKYHIDDLGDFTPGANNTIVFRHHREPIVIGGSITPPVERLTDEKIKMQRMRTYNAEYRSKSSDTPAQRRVERVEHTEPRGKASSKSQRMDDDDSLYMAKPESYLRGLKYDQRKNKKREEDMFSSQQSRGKFNIVIMVIAAIIVGVVIWLILPYLDINILGSKREDTTITNEIGNEIIEPVDTTYIDTERPTTEDATPVATTIDNPSIERTTDAVTAVNE